MGKGRGGEGRDWVGVVGKGPCLGWRGGAWVAEEGPGGGGGSRWRRERVLKMGLDAIKFCI